MAVFRGPGPKKQTNQLAPLTEIVQLCWMAVDPKRNFCDRNANRMREVFGRYCIATWLILPLQHTPPSVSDGSPSTGAGSTETGHALLTATHGNNIHGHPRNTSNFQGFHGSSGRTMAIPWNDKEHIQAIMENMKTKSIHLQCSSNPWKRHPWKLHEIQNHKDSVENPGNARQFPETQTRQSKNYN